MAFVEDEIPEIQKALVSTLLQLDSLQIYEQSLELKLNTDRRNVLQKLANENPPFIAVLALQRVAFQRHREFFLSRQQQRKHLEQDLIMQRDDFQFTKHNLENWRSELTKQTKQIQTMELMRTRLARNISVYQETFAQFSKLMEEARIAQEQASGDIQIVSRASTYETLYPEKRQGLTLAIAIGLLVSVFLAFTLEYFQKAKQRLSETSQS